jgi:lysophospholipase L1-like esterase
MGSSYAAGPNIAASADTPPTRCARSAANYAHVLAAARQLDLIDVTCSGATTQHILGPWGNLPAQIDAVTPATRLVTITIGGNDLGYMAAIGVLRCPDIAAADRQRWFGGTCPAPHAISAQDKADLAARMARIIHQIRERAPAARILFVQYFALMPAAGNCPATGLTDAQVPQIRAIALDLAQLTAQVAHAEGAEVVPLDQVSAAHALCSAQPWMNGASPDMAAHDGVPYHPNALGMAGAARLIADYLR